jgi:ATP-dependent Clp protease ATP-binding subunit ClpA
MTAIGIAWTVDWHPLPRKLSKFSGREKSIDSRTGPTTQRKQQYTTLEHLLLALIDDADASAVMKACKIDLARYKEKLTD